jgi:hypothetical protein
MWRTFRLLIMITMAPNGSAGCSGVRTGDTDDHGSADDGATATGRRRGTAMMLGEGL